MQCPKCGSTNISASVINEVHTKPEHGCLWWILVGWWWRLIWFIFFGWYYLIWRAIRGGRRVENVQKTVCLCQYCGHRWEI